MQALCQPCNLCAGNQRKRGRFRQQRKVGVQRQIRMADFGIGAAQQMVAQAQSVAGQFASMQAHLGSQYLGQLNQLTTISPAQAVGFAFDERAYQTGVEQFNATGMWNATTFSANYGLQAAQLDMQRQQFEAQMQALMPAAWAASTTRQPIDGAQGPCSATKRAAWLPGSLFRM